MGISLYSAVMRTAFVFLVCFSMLLGVIVSFPQPANVQAKRPTAFIIQDGTNACNYLVVERFFECAKRWHDWYLRDEKFGTPLLNMADGLGISPGTEAWEILVHSADRAYAISNMPIPSSRLALQALGPAGFKRAQQEATRRKAASLGRLYAGFLREMARAGVPEHQIHQFLESEIRPTVKVVSTQPLEHPDNQALLRCLRAFDEEMP